MKKFHSNLLRLLPLLLSISTSIAPLISYAEEEERQGSYIIFMNDSKPEVIPLPAEDAPSISLPLATFQEKFFIQTSKFLDWNSSGIKVKFKRTLTLMGDGPHFDSIGDVSQSSDWLALKRTSSYVWELPDAGDISYTQSGPVKVERIVAELSKTLKDEPLEARKFWLERAQECVPPFEKSCAWGMNKLTLQIDSPQMNRTIEFLVPMGC